MSEDKFAGFKEPQENWSKLPHDLIVALPLIETQAELKVILYILRHTWGYQDDEKRITLDEFANGRKRKDGSRIDNGTGLTVPSIRDGLKRAEAHGFIIVEVDDSDKARVKKFYSLNVAQTEKDLQSGCKNLSSGVQESFNRSEKETLERNFEKETNNAPDGAPPVPPKPSPPAVQEPNEITLERDQTEWVCYRGCGETVTWRKGQTACPKCGWPVRFEKAQEPVSEVAGEPTESLEPDTPNGRVLFARLQREARARSRRGPKRFPSLACKRKFTEAERRLDGHFEEALDAGLVKGITSVPAMVNWLAKYRPGRRSGKKRKPPINENTLAAVYQDMEAH